MYHEFENMQLEAKRSPFRILGGFLIKKKKKLTKLQIVLYFRLKSDVVLVNIVLFKWLLSYFIPH